MCQNKFREKLSSWKDGGWAWNAAWYYCILCHNNSNIHSKKEGHEPCIHDYTHCGGCVEWYRKCIANILWIYPKLNSAVALDLEYIICLPSEGNGYSQSDENKYNFPLRLPEWHMLNSLFPLSKVNSSGPGTTRQASRAYGDWGSLILDPIQYRCSEENSYLQTRSKLSHSTIVLDTWRKVGI